MESMKQPLTIALAKGRLADKAMVLLEGAGVCCQSLKVASRKLVLEDEAGGYRFILVKPSDVPTYVHHGVADIGFAGKDTLLEENLPLYEMLDLGFGNCRLCICGPDQVQKRPITTVNLTVATKYPHIARTYYEAKGETIDIIKLNGSVELGPLVGLSDVILDIVESGATLRENGLAVLEEVCTISARMVVGRVSLKTKGEKIRALIQGIEAQIQTKEEKK